MKILKRIKQLDKKKVLLIIGGMILVVILIVVINLLVIRQSTYKYNEAVRTYNHLSEAYDGALKQTCVDNIVGIPTSYGTLEIVDESFEAYIGVLIGDNSAIKISKDTTTILSYCEEIEMMLVVLEQITVPETSWVVGKLGEIADISGTELVAENNNPDGLLNKEGGYVGCIYFSLREIDQTTVPGDSIVAKGTDCGGAIEIYASLEEAEARCEYLAGFDGTILYSGSYAIVGTIVVRTSYILSNERQWEITSAITKKLTEVEFD